MFTSAKANKYLPVASFFCTLVTAQQLRLKKIVAKHLVVWQNEEFIKKTLPNNNNPSCYSFLWKL